MTRFSKIVIVTAVVVALLIYGAFSAAVVAESAVSAKSAMAVTSATSAKSAMPATKKPEGPERWEKTIQKFESEDAAGKSPHGGILFVGSSSIVKWHLADYFPELPVVNRGFGGSYLSEVAHFAKRLVAPLKPRQIILYAGDNDLAVGVTPEKLASYYREFVATVRAAQPEVPIIFISIKPSPARRALLDKTKEANRLIEAETKRGKNLSYLDVFTPMLGPDGEPRAELFVGDKLHMNDAGYKLWTKMLAPLLKD